MAGLTDIPGLRVGHASDYDGLTGCTVVLCGPEGAAAGVDLRGSATGTVEADLLHPLHVTERVHAVVLAGGSAFGLEASAGVRRHLEQQGIGFPFGGARVPLVPGAILFDLGIGKPTARPTREMGESAAAAATGGPVPEGSVGAGTGATVGKLLGMRHAMKGGIGTASVRLEGAYTGVRVAALVAVNAFGDVRDAETGRLVAGTRVSPEGMELLGTASRLKAGPAPAPQRENTTLAVVATNARLSKVGANRLARMASAGMARAIDPVFTSVDGDVTFALSLGTQEADPNALGVAAAEALAQAILRAVRKAKGYGGVPGLV